MINVQVISNLNDLIQKLYKFEVYKNLFKSL